MSGDGLTVKQRKTDCMGQVNMFELANGRWKLSPTQLALPWDWVLRGVTPERGKLVGLVVPADPKDPEKFPERRLLLSDYLQDED